MNKLFLLSAFSVLAPLPALAVLKPGDIAAKSIAQFDVQGRRPELCVIPNHLAGNYSSNDEKAETDLCDLNTQSEKVAACPKLNSTNPGVLFQKPPKGVSKEEYLAKGCSMDGDKKLAKYKLSTSCSYSPSILAYYHVSRALGNIVRVPPAVLRTMDLKRHQSIAQRALKALASKPQDILYQTWSSLKSVLDRGAASPRADLVLVEGYDQSYGALQKNPKGDEFYAEFFNKGTDRVAAFRDQNKIYQGVSTANFKISRDYNQVNVQAMAQMRDASDFILLDTILGQQDRMGNIHYQLAYLYPSTEGGKFRLVEAGDLDDVPASLQSKAVQVKQLLLKDNDCGVAKENLIKKAKLLDRVAHMNPATYRNLLKLEQSLGRSETRDFFRHGLQFTEQDFRTVAGNIQEATRLLKSRCQSGQLKLDLDLDAHFSGQALPPKKCDL